MRDKFGPSRGEILFRAAVSAIGLLVVVGALVFRGIPTSAGGWEAIGLATLFFGGTLIWSLRKLRQTSFSDTE